MLLPPNDGILFSILLYRIYPIPHILIQDGNRGSVPPGAKAAMGSVPLGAKAATGSVPVVVACQFSVVVIE